jgi:hypothetical protein
MHGTVFPCHPHSSSSYTEKFVCVRGRAVHAAPHLDQSNNSIAWPERNASFPRLHAPTNVTTDTHRGGCWEERTRQSS